MGLLDRAKLAAEQAATKAKEGVEDVQTKRDLNAAYNELGTKAFQLVDSGELTQPQFDDLVARIRSLKAKLDDDGGSGSSTDTAEAPASSGPPAMPV
jgi:hypothetical protein